ncbi:hypothetical protein ACS0TY_032370 [Phlomoides rotata]
MSMPRSRRALGGRLLGLLGMLTGRCVKCYGERFGGGILVEVAEALALRQGLEYAIEQGVRDIVVETDSQVVIRALLSPKHDLTHFGRLIRSILEVATLFDRVTYSWVRRTGNVEADLMPP